MDNKQFDVVLDNTLTLCRDVMGSKSAEYARGRDKLHNFKRASGVLGVSPEKALLGFKAKHTVSIMDIVDDLDSGKLPTVELLCEKIGDEINYLILLKACILERIYAHREENPVRFATGDDLKTVLEKTGDSHQ